MVRAAHTLARVRPLSPAQRAGERGVARFLLLAVLLSSAAWAQSPEGADPVPPEPHAVVLLITADGRTLLDGVALGEDALAARLKELAAYPEARVAIGADKSVPYDWVVARMAQAKAAGIGRVALLVDVAPDVPPDAGAPPGEPSPDAGVEAPGAPPPPAFSKVVEATGYADSRSSYSRSRTWGLVPTDDFPQLQELLELNTQVKVSVRPRTSFYSDVSLVANAAGNYRSADKDGNELVLPDRNALAAQPTVSINELYFLHEFLPELNVLVGKKRVVWGSGLVYNPTDFFNARRDPTDPTFQRSGAWLLQLEVPLSVMTFDVVFLPQVLRQASGIPTHFLAWPEWDQRDEELHWQLAARAYALVGDADVNLMLFYGNRYSDAFEDKVRVGLSFSRYFFTDYELHLEALIQSGSPRDFIEAPCVASTLEAFKCHLRGKPFVRKKLLDDPQLYPRVLAGTRRQFSDESMLSIEYLWQADGWTRSDFQSFANGLDLVREARASGLPLSASPAAGALFGATSADGLPTRFSFEPRGQHYLFVTFQKPRIKDDFTAQVVVIANLVDLSTMWTPSVAWSATEWLTLTLFGFFPLQGPDRLSEKTPSGALVSEYGTLPFEYRVMFEARAYF